MCASCDQKRFLGFFSGRRQTSSGCVQKLQPKPAALTTQSYTLFQTLSLTVPGLGRILWNGPSLAKLGTVTRDPGSLPLQRTPPHANCHPQGTASPEGVWQDGCVWGWSVVINIGMHPLHTNTGDVSSETIRGDYYLCWHFCEFSFYPRTTGSCPVNRPLDPQQWWASATSQRTWTHTHTLSLSLLSTPGISLGMFAPPS